MTMPVDETQVTFLIGGLGAGKTELALNLAIRRARQLGPGLSHLLDLDIVNPFFRVRHLRDALEREGVKLIAPDAQVTANDMPALPGAAFGILARHDTAVVCDVGGGELGLRVLGRLAQQAAARKAQTYFVINPYRPGFLNPDQMRKSFELLCELSSLEVTHIVANPHLINETTPELFEAGLAKVRTFAETMRIPIAFSVAAPALLRLLPHTAGASSDEAPTNLVEYDGQPLLVLDRYWETPWIIGKEQEVATCPNG
ncbi:MAG TPA: hypothetical protein PLP29_05065 [Candidatus Ozemobacteraceae bacterium]|nr:hypothetical protein [Candidatus Ozemobacteraceae bacterium]